MAKKYLDEQGLAHLWQKIKGKINNSVSTYLPKTGGTLSGVVNGGAIDTHPENNGTIISYYTNDLAFLRQRGGSYVVKDITTDTVLADSASGNTSNADNMFDGSPAYYYCTPNQKTDTVEIFIKSPVNYSWSCQGGIGFGSGAWSASNVKMEVGYSATNKGTAQNPDSDIVWVTRIERTNNNSGLVYGGLNGPNASEGGINSSTWSYLRVTLSNFCIGARIAQVFSINYNSKGMHNTFLGLNGGTLYGGLNVKGTLSENGTTLANKYLGIKSQAADSAKLGGVSADKYATQDWVTSQGYTKNIGTVTGVTVNGTTKTPTSGIVDIGTVITSHQDVKTLNTNNESTLTPTSESIIGSGTLNLHKISKTGNYNDLLNKPTIPTASDYVTVSTNQTVTGQKTFNAPSFVSGQDQATATFKTSNGGQLIIGKEGAYSGTMLRFDQEAGTVRLRFRASETPGAIVWEQPEGGSCLYYDVSQVQFRNPTKITLKQFTGGLLKTDSNGALSVDKTQYATKADVMGVVKYMGTVATQDALAALAPDSIGDFSRASAAFTLEATYSSTGSAEEVHASDMLVCEDETNKKYAVIHGEIDVNTWVENSKDADGYVTKGEGQANKVWKTDANGNPAWRDDANTVYTHPAGNAASKTSGFYKFSTDATSHINNITAVTKADITGLGIPAQDTDTKNTAGATNSTSKLYLVGATSQAVSPQTYSNSNVYIGTDNCLYSNGAKVLTAHQSLSAYATQDYVQSKVMHFVEISATYNSDYTGGTFTVITPSNELCSYLINNPGIVAFYENDFEFTAFLSNATNDEWVAVKKNTIFTLSLDNISAEEISGTIEVSSLARTPEYGIISLVPATMSSSGTSGSDTIYKTSFNAGDRKHIKLIMSDESAQGLSKVVIQSLDSNNNVLASVNISLAEIVAGLEIDLFKDFYIKKLASGVTTTNDFTINDISTKLVFCLYVNTINSSDYVDFRYVLGD